MSTSDPVVFDPLDRDGCRTLLAGVPDGRIAITDQAMPATVLVNFLLDGSDVIRSVAGSKFAAATRRAVVAWRSRRTCSSRSTVRAGMC
jgi:hypothetical protein